MNKVAIIMNIKLLLFQLIISLLITSCQKWTLPEKIAEPISLNKKWDKDLPFTEMANIPAGTFVMGDVLGDSRDNSLSDEIPVHSVRLDGFYMSKYEVTQRQWAKIMGSNPSFFNTCADCPVEQVSWDDVQEFMKKLNSATGSNYRLPTEAEWEYAAGGGASNRTRFGNGLDILEPSGANYDASKFATSYSGIGEFRAKTVQVGSFRSNQLGLYDMTGNVAEWCSDYYGLYTTTSSVNPKGPSTGEFRVIRGGSWFISGRFSRLTFREALLPDKRYSSQGFRIVLSQ